MKILIVGDGKVGYTLADQLSHAKHDVVIIDKNEEALRKADDQLDVLCIRGNGMRSSILMDAGVAEADLLIAATSTDEMNMVCCLTAKKLGAKYTVARIRDPEYAYDVNMIKRELDIDMVINPEQATAREISRILRFPGVIKLDTFVRGKVEMAGFVIAEGDFVAGAKLASLRKRIPSEILFCARERNGEVLIPGGEDIFLAGDRVYVTGEPPAITHFFRSLGRNNDRIRDAMIVGGGRIAQYLADLLMQMGVKIKLIELSEKRCHELSEALSGVTVIHADGTDLDVLDSENFTETDAFVSLTDRDEDNLMVALCAMQNGIARVVAKSNRQNYAPVVHALGLDSVVSPKTITAAQIIHLVRGLENSEGSVMETLYPIVDGRAEAAEFKVTKELPHLGKPFKNIPLKPGILIAVIVRRNRIIIPNGSSTLEPGDSVIIVSVRSSIRHLKDIFVSGVLS